MQLKCKSCGGNMVFNGDDFSMRCESCGSTQIAVESKSDEEQSQIFKQQQLSKEKQEQRKKAAIKFSVLAIVFLVIFGLLGSTIYKNIGYSANNLTIKVISKSNLKFNEDMADGYTNAGYFYAFEFELDNKSPNDIRLIRGNFEIINKQGRTLCSSSLEMHCDLKADSSGRHIVQLNLSKGDAARELWNSELEDLLIKFRVKTIRFEDGTDKNYSNTKNKTVYPH